MISADSKVRACYTTSTLIFYASPYSHTALKIGKARHRPGGHEVLYHLA